MKTMEAASFKARCLAVIDEVHSKSETLLITKHGKPLAKLTPCLQEAEKIYGFLEGKGVVRGDIISPAIKEWVSLNKVRQRTQQRIPALRADRKPQT